MIRKEYMQMILDEIGTNRPISDDYWPEISAMIIDDVIQNVEETADEEEWNEDDVRLAVGRVLLDRLVKAHANQVTQDKLRDI